MLNQNPQFNLIVPRQGYEHTFAVTTVPQNTSPLSWKYHEKSSRINWKFLSRIDIGKIKKNMGTTEIEVMKQMCFLGSDSKTY